MRYYWYCYKHFIRITHTIIFILIIHNPFPFPTAWCGLNICTVLWPKQRCAVAFYISSLLCNTKEVYSVSNAYRYKSVVLQKPHGTRDSLWFFCVGLLPRTSPDISMLHQCLGHGKDYWESSVPEAFMKWAQFNQCGASLKSGWLDGFFAFLCIEEEAQADVEDGTGGIK